MARPRPWTVLPHGPIQRLEPNLWSVDAAIPGMPLERRMVVIRLDDGRLVVHSAVCLDEAAMTELAVFGEPAFLVVPNGWHRLDAHAWAERFPRLRVLCPAAARKRVAQVVRVDGDFSLLPQDGALRVEPLDGVRAGEAVFLVRSGDRLSAVFTDAVMNLPHGKGLWWWLYRYVSDSTGGPKVTGLFRWVGVASRPALRAHLERVAALDGLYRLVPGHGGIVEGPAAAEALRTAAGRL